MMNCLCMMVFILLSGITRSTPVLQKEQEETEVEDLKDLLYTSMQSIVSLNELVTALSYSVSSLTLSFAKTNAEMELKTAALIGEIEDLKKKMSERYEESKCGESSEKKVPIDGGWCKFGNWSDCSVKCNGGKQIRTRTCTNPAPMHGGSPCEGEAHETMDCGSASCPVDGGWTDFGGWSNCSVQCGEGKQTRSRTCSNPPPENGGADCVGELREVRSCNNEDCPTPETIPDAKFIDELVAVCAHHKIYFNGADMFHRVYGRVEDCAIDCLRTNNCKSISYRVSDRQCFFRSKAGGAYGATNNDPFISMNMECNRDTVDLSCQREGLNFPGADLKNLVVSSPEECTIFCRDTEDCKSFTYREADKRCYLKSKRGGASGPTVASGHKSMNMQCDNSKPTNLDCLREGFNFPGNDLRHLIVADEEECLRYCRDTEACTSLTFRESDKRCYLKSKRGGAVGPTVASGHNSMNMQCDNTEVTNLGCLREGFHFPGADLQNLIVADEEECVRQCRDTEACVALTFRESDKRCYLKSERGGSIGPTVALGYNSMNMHCDNSAVENLGCLKKGFNFPGADLRNLVVADEEECVKHCRDTNACTALTFRESDQRCYLKSKRGGQAGPMLLAGHNSMNMLCNYDALEHQDCLREGFNFPGSDVRNLIVADEEECIEHCSDTDRCVSFTFRVSDNQCFMKSRRGGASGPTGQVGYNSMNMDCDNTDVTNLDCLRTGFNFPGADLRSLVVADEEECVKHCRDTQACTAVTFRSSDSRCFLKSSRGGASGPTVEAGYNSMNMECDNSAVDLSCTREDENFPGHDIKSLVLEDLEECLRTCRDVENCHSVTFSKIQKLCSLKSKKFGWQEERSTANVRSTNLICEQ